MLGVVVVLWHDGAIVALLGFGLFGSLNLRLGGNLSLSMGTNGTLNRVMGVSWRLDSINGSDDERLAPSIFAALFLANSLVYLIASDWAEEGFRRVRPQTLLTELDKDGSAGFYVCIGVIVFSLREGWKGTACAAGVAITMLAALTE